MMIDLVDVILFLVLYLNEYQHRDELFYLNKKKQKINFDHLNELTYVEHR